MTSLQGNIVNRVKRLPKPSLAAEVLRTAQTDLDALTAEIDALTRQKRGLMQKLLTANGA